MSNPFAYPFASMVPPPIQFIGPVPMLDPFPDDLPCLCNVQLPPGAAAFDAPAATPEPGGVGLLLVMLAAMVVARWGRYRPLG